MSVTRRIFAKTINFLSGVSLLLGVVLIACWIRAQWRIDWWQFHRTNLKTCTWRGLDVVPCRSYLFISWQAFYFDRPSRTTGYAQLLERTGTFRHFDQPSVSGTPPGNFWNRQGFAVHNEPWSTDTPSDEEGRGGHYIVHYTYRVLSLPHWFILILLACGGLPLISEIRAARLRRRRQRNNQCVSCGYDLRNSPDRCPECGQPTNASSEPATA